MIRQFADAALSAGALAACVPYGDGMGMAPMSSGYGNPLTQALAAAVSGGGGYGAQAPYGGGYGMQAPYGAPAPYYQAAPQPMYAPQPQVVYMPQAQPQPVYMPQQGAPTYGRGYGGGYGGGRT